MISDGIKVRKNKHNLEGTNWATAEAASVGPTNTQIQFISKIINVPISRIIEKSTFNLHVVSQK